MICGSGNCSVSCFLGSYHQQQDGKQRTVDDPAAYNVDNSKKSSGYAEEPSMVNDWQHISKLDATASGRRSCQPWLVILLAGGSCESKSLVLQVGGCLLGQSPDSRMKEISEKT